ncbi:MAG: hypothetical protein ACD_19C00428G0008 [uncultured bacterium]|nr:MAG: hypothetical protein ACD_19C00428G0008 [uncultured bacterium]
MSIIFYDHLIVIKGLDKKIKKLVSSNDEAQELWSYVEELIHHRVLECCLGDLPEENHKEFLEKFHKAPHDKGLLDYLNQKIGKDVEKLIKTEIKKLTKELVLLK